METVKMSLTNWYELGISPETYMASLDKHQDNFSYIYNNIDLSTFEKDATFFQFLEDKKLRVIALAEPWCGHCMLNIPILLRLGEKVNMPVRLLPRDENLELMDQYLTNGKSRSIPIFIFIDEFGEEVAKWGPIAEETKQYTSELMKNMPAKDAPDYDELFTAAITTLSESFRENSDFWRYSYESMKKSLQNL